MPSSIPPVIYNAPCLIVSFSPCHPLTLCSPAAYYTTGQLTGGKHLHALYCTVARYQSSFPVKMKTLCSEALVRTNLSIPFLVPSAFTRIVFLKMEDHQQPRQEQPPKISCNGNGRIRVSTDACLSFRQFPGNTQNGIE